jgi:threonine synthase
MRYVSTRGEAAPLDFVEVMLAGLARDGGLYVPEQWPTLDTAAIAGFAGRPYAEIACEVMRPFIAGALPDADVARIAQEAYGSFRHPATAPLTQVSPSTFVLELFHGPTLAFKDLAMQLVSRLMDHVLRERGQRATICVATSGDTGGAAVEAFRGRSQVDLIVLYPDNRISEVQRRMMTTAKDDNVHAVAVEGTFDDCQALVKAMFNHHAFRDQVRLSAVALGAPARKVAFTVPTGNFGDVYAGYVAGRMGLPVDRLVIATNVNDILARTLATGAYEIRGVTPTTSPSMDIQISSNFERLLFDAYRRDAAAIRALMGSLTQSKSFNVSSAALGEMRKRFSAERADEQEVAATMRATYREADYCIDPHTAVALAVAEKEVRDPKVPMIVLSTAHPAKFPDAVAAATGVTPKLPDWLGDLNKREERITVLPPDQAAVEKFVSSKSRAAREGAAA